MTHSVAVRPTKKAETAPHRDYETLVPHDGEWPAYFTNAPCAYVAADDGTICAACANGGNGSRSADPSLDPNSAEDARFRIVDQVDTSEYDYPSGLRCDLCHTIIVFPGHSQKPEQILGVPSAKRLLEDVRRRVDDLENRPFGDHRASQA